MQQDTSQVELDVVDHLVEDQLVDSQVGLDNEVEVTLEAADAVPATEVATGVVVVTYMGQEAENTLMQQQHLPNNRKCNNRNRLNHHLSRNLKDSLKMECNTLFNILPFHHSL